MYGIASFLSFKMLKTLNVWYRLAYFDRIAYALLQLTRPESKKIACFWNRNLYVQYIVQELL